MPPKKEIIQKEETYQAVLIADDFSEEFQPFTGELPLVLFPLNNKPIIDYTLELLALGGINETYVFCVSHSDQIKKHISDAIEMKALWNSTMSVHVVVSESCGSHGDCLRDLYGKGVIRGNFVLVEPGVIGNLKLLPLLKEHNEILKQDKSAAMTLIYQEVGLKQYGQNRDEKMIVTVNENRRILTHKYLKNGMRGKLDFPLDIFLENQTVSIKHNLRDSHLAICSHSVLSIFSDNFDYQTRADFVRSVLMIDEIMESTVYCRILEKDEQCAAVTNWHMYQAISRDLNSNFFHPITTNVQKSRAYKGDVFTGVDCVIPNCADLKRCVLGDGVIIKKNVKLQNAYILSKATIREGSTIENSLIGENCVVGKDNEISGCIFGNNTKTPPKFCVKNALIKFAHPKDVKTTETMDKLADCVYKLTVNDDDTNEDYIVKKDNPKIRDLYHEDLEETSECDEDESDTDSENEMSYTNSPIPEDDTNMFFNEVVDSLVRGFDDKLKCDNLILEINSSRYAYNVSLKEVNYHVSKAILSLPFQQESGAPYMQVLSRSLAYFSPILKNYLRNQDAMSDCLQAIEDVAVENDDAQESVSKILHWFYDKDHLDEEAIIEWAKRLEKTSNVYKRIIPFVKWLQEAEEESSSSD